METCFDDADKVAPIDCCRQQSRAIDSTLQPFNFSTFQPSSCHLSLGFRLDPAPPPADNSFRCPSCAPTPPPKYRRSRKQAKFPVFFPYPNSLSPGAPQGCPLDSIRAQHGPVFCHCSRTSLACGNVGKRKQAPLLESIVRRTLCGKAVALCPWIRERLRDLGCRHPCGDSAFVGCLGGVRKMEMVGAHFCVVCRRMVFDVRRFSLLLEMSKRNETMSTLQCCGGHVA